MCFVTTVMVFQEYVVADYCTQLRALPSSCLNPGHDFNGAAQPRALVHNWLQTGQTQ